MASIDEHYNLLLAGHYTWMAGGYAAGVLCSENLLKQAGVPKGSGDIALDLGCGSGFQSVALAGLGYRVVSVDTSQALLDELALNSVGLPIQPLFCDMRHVDRFLHFGPYSVVACLGDSILSLNSFDEVSTLVRQLWDCLNQQSIVVFGFRNLEHELTGIDRAIPVRLDDDRLLATFLEYEPEHVVINDLLFTKNESGWQMDKSCYKKLRLDPHRLLTLLQQFAFDDLSLDMEQGACLIVARRH